MDAQLVMTDIMLELLTGWPAEHRAFLPAFICGKVGCSPGQRPPVFSAPLVGIRLGIVLVPHRRPELLGFKGTFAKTKLVTHTILAVLRPVFIRFIEQRNACISPIELWQERSCQNPQNILVFYSCHLVVPLAVRTPGNVVKDWHIYPCLRTGQECIVVHNFLIIRVTKGNGNWLKKNSERH